MEYSEKALRGTRFFDEVKLDDERTNIPGRRDLRIIVKEGRTGNMVFGAGFSTVESFVVTAEVSQSNFDFLNWRNMFQGAGQKFRIRGSLGLESNQIMISFANPWIFNRRLEYGFDLYRTDSGYYSDYYSEVRLGMIHYLRKNLWADIEGRLGYTIEDVNLYDMKHDTPDFIRAEEGHRSVSKISLSFLRDMRDDTMMPTSGTRFEILQQVAGGPLMGQTNIYKVEARAGWWFPVSRTFGNDLSVLKYGDQVFSVVGRVGSVTGYGGKDVPYFEQYFLGGSYNLRGFKFRKAGKVDPVSSEPYGGNTMGFLSFEYSVRIIEQFRIALFYDIGFQNSNSWDFDPSDYSDDFGIGFRILLMGAPMRIDVGMPITKGNGVDNGIQFNFSFGTVF
jgi:outer membrane protein insertion porin family